MVGVQVGLRILLTGFRDWRRQVDLIRKVPSPVIASVDVREARGECPVTSRPSSVLDREEPAILTRSLSLILVPVMADCDWSLFIVSHSVL